MCEVAARWTQAVNVQAGGQADSAVWTVPNVVSMLRLALVPVFAVLIVVGEDVWALVVLAASGATDWLDGVLARRLNQVTKLGQMLDPAADRLFILVTLIGLTWRGVIPWWVLAVIVARDVMLAFLVRPLARRGYGPVPVTFVGKAGTFALLYAFPLLLLAAMPGGVGAVAHVIGWAFAWWGIGLYWLAGFQYVRHVRRLVTDDRGEAQTEGAA
ncbi:CDP-alcohol phosphatidyltransferase family protein [Isoptericola sp. JC619]|uniref:CDP-alcohol phosphatidyltransferase family protein n=1 Tax=Isoptericola sediminis TaxID=2733572 RepID=A0A849JSC5_9MICO|nr:CDP-alcohol phosphatidyltransferase family protein [Isoptericola sediminis]